MKSDADAPERELIRVGDRALAADLAVCAIVSVAIAAASDHLLLMTILVPLLQIARLITWQSLGSEQRGTASARAEVAFCVLCTVLGATNDWISVVRHRIYDYQVPVWYPAWSTIPLWMLLYWGSVLRAMASLAGWERLSSGLAQRNEVRFHGRAVRSAPLKIALELLLVISTRQCIYRWYLDPLWSWLPFAVALLAYVKLFPRSCRDWLFAAIVLCVGPAVEVIYIQVGWLHRYHLGWIAGVPLWIVLWWVLASWVWRDLAPRLQQALARALPAR